MQESYFKAMASAPIVVAGEGEEEVELDYDSDGNPIVPERSKVSSKPHSHVYDIFMTSL